jgi:hypothetical protein
MTTTIETMLEALERLLQLQLDGHQRLIALLDEKREAIRTARMERLTETAGEERQIIQRLGEVERHRLELVRRIMEGARPKSKEPMTMHDITALADEPLRTRLDAIAAQLRDVVTEVRRRSSIIRSAAETLARHMGAVCQTVQSALSRAGVYGRGGELTTGAQLQFSVDTKC